MENFEKCYASTPTYPNSHYTNSPHLNLGTCIPDSYLLKHKESKSAGNMEKSSILAWPSLLDFIMQAPCWSFLHSVHVWPSPKYLQNLWQPLHPTHTPSPKQKQKTKTKKTKPKSHTDLKFVWSSTEEIIFSFQELLWDFTCL